MKSSCLAFMLLIGTASAWGQAVRYPLKRVDSLFRAGNYIMALRENSEYLAKKDVSSDCRDYPLALFRAGEIFDMFKDRAKASEFLHRALAVSKECGNDSVKWLATRYLGGFFHGSPLRDSVLYYLLPAYEMVKNANRPRDVSSVTGMLAETYKNFFGDHERALYYYNLSMSNAELAGDYRSIGYACLRFGSFKLRIEKNCKEAVALLEKSHHLFTSNKDTEGEQWSAKTLAVAYHECGRAGDAFELISRHSSKQDSIFSAETAEQLAHYAMFYETEKKEKENLALALRIENETRLRRNQMIFFGSGVVVIIIFFVILYRQYTLRKRAEMESKIHADRERVSRELHDNIGTQLTQLSSSLDWAQNKSTPLNSAEREAIIGHAVITTREVIGDLREAIWALKKIDISLTDFCDKLKGNLQHNPLTSKIRVTFQENIRDTKLSPEEALDLLRICQEAVANAIQHSGCSGIDVVIESQGTNYRIEIADNGSGFDIHTQRTEHYGIENMKQRARQIGATLQISSASGEGTKVIVVK